VYRLLVNWSSVLRYYSLTSLLVVSTSNLSSSLLLANSSPPGLDSFNAFNVIECLVFLARNYNRIVIFTIHQPRSNIVTLFDQLVLLAQGQLVYAGALSKCQDYFESIGHLRPPGFNLADYLSKFQYNIRRRSKCNFS